MAAATIDVPHPNRGSGPTFRTKHSFEAARCFVGEQGVRFRSTTDEPVTATQAWTKDGHTPTIAFTSVTREGSACLACWGYRRSCSGSRIGEFAEALDQIMGDRTIIGGPRTGIVGSMSEADAG